MRSLDDENTSMHELTYTGTHRQVGGIRPQPDFELFGKRVELLQTLPGKLCHDNTVVCPWLWKSGHRNITIPARCVERQCERTCNGTNSKYFLFYLPDGFNFENSTTLCDVIECLIYGFKECEHLRRLADGRPSCKARNVCKHDRCVGKLKRACEI